MSVCTRCAIASDGDAVTCIYERCDECGIWTRDPHYPHDRGCENAYKDGLGCTCDHVACSGCCWDCRPTGVAS